MTLEKPSTESETVKLFTATIDFYISSSKPWEVDSLNQLLDSGGFTPEEIQHLTELMNTAKREQRAGLVREQLAKILVGEDMVKGAKDHISRMGAPKPPPIQTPFQTATIAKQNLPYEIEEMLRQKEYAQYEKMKNAGIAQASIMDPMSKMWKNSF